MAIHKNYQSMVRDSLKEKIEIAELCIEKRKTPDKWDKDNGCFGVPAAILLLSIADSIGSYVIGGNTEKHFQILNHHDYYNLKLEPECISEIYKLFRNYLTHNSGLGVGAGLALNSLNSEVYVNYPEEKYIALMPFLEVSKTVVIKFINQPDSMILESEPYKNFKIQAKCFKTKMGDY